MGFKTVIRPAPSAVGRLPRLWDSTDECGFEQDDGAALGEDEAFADTVRESDLGSRLRTFFAEVADELEDQFEDTQPFVRQRRTA